MKDGEERWLDQDAGPVVRPYTITRGRTRVTGEQLDLLATVIAVGPADSSVTAELTPEQSRILDACRRPASVAEVASEVALPLTVVRILLSDLRKQGLIRVRQPARAAQMPAPSLLREVIQGLKAL